MTDAGCCISLCTLILQLTFETAVETLTKLSDVVSLSTAPEDQSSLNFGVIVTLFNITSNMLDSTTGTKLEEKEEIEVS